ncbi:hypothetical protein QF037_004642 [Streptomyces canus]|uniref:FxSxx-COOH system tetratricopeptide repeat protein n=1 Tax=Streptomyces canus TaxID=58343 RepID=UPI00278688EC|nr:FxSxx-COOH system tetratricopeptide repeat protein [Streptomyces canus]MDQ0600297.1 hypothetical protein [Streptomyces canus]
MNKLDGKVVTFYSYKGGVGRSFLLSNTATLLAQWGYRVLCIDWDLEAPGLHYYFRPHMESPETGLVEMVLGARDGQPVDALGHITPVTFPDGSRLDLIAAGGVGGDYIPNVQGIDWDALYEERDFGNVLEDWRRRWIESYDVIFVDSRTGISDSGGICTAQLPHILAYAFTANQQNVDGVLEVVGRAAKARNGLPYDRSRLLTLPLLCRFDMSEEYERAADWRRKLQPALKSSYNAWVPEGAAVERVLDHCTVPYSAYWSFGEELPVLTEDFRNPQLISYSIASIAGLIARHLEDVRLFTESRDSYVDAAIRTGRRGGGYPYDFFISSAPNTSDDARLLAGLLAAEGFSSYSLPTEVRPGGHFEDLRTAIATCRHFILLARDTVGSFQQGELNHFLRQTLDEQADRVLFPVVTPRGVVRDLPTIVQSIQAFKLSAAGLPDVARTIRARLQGNGSPSSAPGYGDHPPDERLLISSAGTDRAWAEWVAWQLTDAGYEVELDGRGHRESGRTVALLSRAYLEVDWSVTEAWITDLAARERLVPVRIDATSPPPALRELVFTDLFGSDEEAARDRLLHAVAGRGARPGSAPEFPGGGRSRRSGEAGPRLPGSLPQVWNVPPRNSRFTGRDDLLGEMRTRLTDVRTVLSLGGQIGVGKTHLAIEYAHRFSGEYDRVWWVEAGESMSVPAQLASFAVAIGRADPSTPGPIAVQNLSMELRTRSRWLIVFDDAQDPAALARHLPTGDGHVLITSRNPHWHQIATPVDVDVLSRAESISLLRSGSQGLSRRDAHRLAEALGDLPLALMQAAESLYIFTPDQFLRELEHHAGTAVGDGIPLDYPRSLTDQLTFSMDLLKERDPLAAALLRACALLAPEPFPLHTCDPEKAGAGEDGGGGALVRELSYPRAFRRILTALERLGLARVAGGSIQVHRLTQAVLRDRLDDEGTQAARDASALLTSAYPGQAANTDSWSRWPALVPHLLAISPNALTSPSVRYAACEACWYLMDHGGARAALPRLEDLYRTWTEHFGALAEATMWAAAYLARAYAEMDMYSEARDLEVDILARQQEVLGEHDPDTLRTAGRLAVCLEALGQTEEARDLATDTLDRQRRVLGEDHPDTLRTAGNLAVYLETLGDTERARALAEDTLNRQRRVLGEDHPDTRHTVDNLVGRPRTVRVVQRPNTAPPGPL